MQRFVSLISLLAIVALLAFSLWLPGRPVSAAQGKGGEVIAKPTPAKKKTATSPAMRRSRPQGETRGISDNEGMTIVLNRPGDEGTLSGVIKWNGPAPQPKMIDTSADPACTSLSTEDLIVNRGKVANVLVFLEAGTTFGGKQLSELSFDVPTNEVVLEQRACRFVPHVVGVQVKQTLKITNDDPTINNVHFVPRNNPDWNQSQPPGTAPLTHRFSYPESERPFSVKDNQHPWKRGYVSVFTHPFFAVTKLDGSFEIRGVPPGTYQLSAWHEACDVMSESKTSVITSVPPKSPKSPITPVRYVRR